MSLSLDTNMLRQGNNRQLAPLRENTSNDSAQPGARDVRRPGDPSPPDKEREYNRPSATDLAMEENAMREYPTSEVMTDEHGNDVIRNNKLVEKRFVFVRWNIINIEDVNMMDGKWVSVWTAGGVRIGGRGNDGR